MRKSSIAKHEFERVKLQNHDLTVSCTQFETDTPLIIVSKIWYHINIEDYYHCKIKMQNNDMDCMLQF